MNHRMLRQTFLHPIMFLAVCIISSQSIAQEVPFTVMEKLFNQDNPDSLGLSTPSGTETITVFAPGEGTDHYSNGVVMTVFKDTLYCQWQSSATDEDAEDTKVVYSKSADGINWSTPMVLAESLEEGYCSSGGWWATDDTLVAYINTWPSSVSPRGGYTRFRTSIDGMNWSEIKALPMADKDTLDGIFEQDPHALPGGRILNAAHFQPGLHVCPVYTDDPTGIRGWQKADFTNLSSSNNVSREIEPSSYLREDGAVVMTFRDQGGSFKRLAAVSYDNGESWSDAALTDMPDSRSKQSAGNLPDGTAFLVGNPRDESARFPLAVALSKDGRHFDQAFNLRKSSDMQELRYAGQYKRAGYHYPKSMVWNDYLYVSYSTNKEDVEYTRFPLISLEELVVNAGGDTIYCPGTDFQLGYLHTAMGGTPPYTYEWSLLPPENQPGMLASQVLNDTCLAHPTLTIDLDSIVFFVKVTDSLGQTGSDTVLVRYNPFIMCLSECIDYIDEGDSTQLWHCIEGGNPPYTYRWSPYGDLSDRYVADPMAWPDETTVFTLTLTDSNGCIMTHDCSIYVEPVSTENSKGEVKFAESYFDQQQRTLHITFNSAETRNANIRIYNIQGKLVLSRELNNTENNLDLEHFDPGIYIYQLYNNNERISNYLLIR